VQTFLPSPSFQETASILDQRRLGKQRVENLQIMKTLVTAKGSWVNHPAVHMWHGYEWALLEYQFAICYEWHVMRGFEDTCLRKTIDLFYSVPWFFDNRDILPFWLGDEEFHYRHQSNLLRKDPEYYRDMFPKDVPHTLDYIWPV
jgi:hypothetical protein